MPDRELPQQLRQRLSASLEGGSPLVAPLASQARFATLRGAVPAPRWRLRALTVAVAAAGIVAVALAGPPQPRQWFVQSVDDITRQVGIPAGAASPSPAQSGPTTSGQRGSSHESPEPSESPEADEQPQAGESPEPKESPEQSGSPESGEGPEPSPTSEPTEDGGGGDHSPEPSPSSGD